MCCYVPDVTLHMAKPTMYKFFCFEIEIKIKADSYMPYEAMAHSTKSLFRSQIVERSDTSCALNSQKQTVFGSKVEMPRNTKTL